MNKRQIWFYGSLLVTLVTLVLLMTGSPVLTISLNDSNTIPLGTFITWAGMISLPLAIYWGVRPLRKPAGTVVRFISVLLKISLILAILWVPISYLLAGNLSFSFSEKATFQGGQTAMKWFWRYSYGIGIVAVASLLAYWISLLFKPKKAK